jgi:ATP/maltotriose-dependent transcriptional regulator MalT
VLRLWIRASADPIGSRNQLLPYLRKIAGSPIEEPSLWRIASAAWLLDESDLAITLLQDAMQRLRAPGVRGTSGGSLTVLGWAYIDTGRWDEALDAAAEAAGLAEANHMDIVAASADVITATVLAMRGDSGAARRHAARARWPPSIRPNAGWWPSAPGGPSASRLSQTAATSRRSPSSEGCSAQRQIVRLAGDGLTDREIGDRLFLSPRTVSSHLYRSYPKLGVASRHQLRDVIALTSTPATAHQSTGTETLL